MKKRKFLWLAASGLMITVLVLASCAPKPTATPSPSPPATPATTLSEGEQLYAQKCASCHGAKGEGTAIAPAVAGHSMTALMAQVRNPMGKMPAFPMAQLSDHDLENIAGFIAGMGMAGTPLMDWEKSAPETIHHWMALVAIKNNDSQDAAHHIQDALTFVKDPKHKPEMEKALSLIAQGNIHDAEHEIEEMAGSESPSGVTRQRFHLTLTQHAVETKSAENVKHHLGHFMVKATEAQKKIAQEALELVEKGDFHEAEHEVEELLKS
ncbi:MAG: cytochrome c [Chloroflexi bacterium]|nr:cytochrome c [Chloroflexota bacterium]